MNANCIEERRRRVWMAIEDRLLTDDLKVIMPPQEWKGLTLLVETLAGSSACSTREPGRIVADYDSEVEVVLLFESMLRRRIEWLGMHGVTRPDPDSVAKPDPHLMVLARRKVAEGVNDEWGREACVVGSNADGLPITDLAATFVMWAGAGFPRMPSTLREQVSFLKGPESYEEFLTAEAKLREEAQEAVERGRQERHAMQARLHEEEELNRRLSEAEDSLSRMDWRALMKAHRGSSLGDDPVSSHIHKLADSLLSPESNVTGDVDLDAQRTEFIR